MAESGIIHYIVCFIGGLIQTKCGYYTNDYNRASATYAEVNCRRCKR